MAKQEPSSLGENGTGSHVCCTTTEAADNTLMTTDLDEGSCSDSGFCPLFMDGLPKDFTANPQLAALASLLEESDEEDKQDDEKDSKLKLSLPAPKCGGGKLQRQKGRRERQSVPYAAKMKKKKSSSMGEAQLFMKMWKL